MSQIFEQSENPLSTDYYDIPDFQKLKINKQQDLRTFLNLVNYKLDIICISKRSFHISPETSHVNLGGISRYITLKNWNHRLLKC